MKTRQDGFTIIEVLVAMVMLALLLTTLAGLTYYTAWQAVRATNMTTQQSISLAAVNRFSTLPFNQLATNAGCDSVGTTNNMYRRCITVTTTGGTAQVQVVTTPLQRSLPASTVQFVRTGPPGNNPLCSGC